MSLKILFRFVSISIFLLIFAILYLVCEQATWGFTISHLKIDKEFVTVNAGIRPFFLKNRFYLQEQGGQAYVFFSEDGKFVLKFFKDAPRPWLRLPRYRTKKWQKLQKTLDGYRLALNHLQKESGVLYLHTAHSSNPLFATLVDRLNIAHVVDLSCCYFVLQKRASIPTTNELKKLIPQIKELIFKRNALKIGDHDFRLHKNLGLIDGNLSFIDPGQFIEEAGPSSELPEKFLDYLNIPK